MKNEARRTQEVFMDEGGELFTSCCMSKQGVLIRYHDYRLRRSAARRHKQTAANPITPMIHTLMSLNYVAVVVVAIIGFLLGWLWYSPLLFAKPWMAEMNSRKKPWTPASRRWPR